MFGQTSPQPGTLFGQSPSQPGSLFGQNVSQPGSLFEQTGSPGFGNPQPGSNAFGTTAGGFSSASTASSSTQQFPSFGQASTFGGGSEGFGQANVPGFGQTTTATSGPTLFGQRSPVTGGFSQTSSSSTGLFGQSAGTGGFGQSSPARPSLFGQSSGSGFGQSATSSGLFGQSALTSQTGSARTTSSLFTGQSTTSNMFGSGGSSAFQSASSASSAFGQLRPSVPSFGNSSLFSQQNVVSTNSSQPPVFGQSASSTGPFGQASVSTATIRFGQSGFGQQNAAGGNFSYSTAAVSPFSQTSAFGPPASTKVAASATTPSNVFGHGGDAFRATASVKPSETGLFGKLLEQSSVATAPSTATQSRQQLISGGFPRLFGKSENPPTSTQPDQRPGLFGKPQSNSHMSLATVKQEPSGQQGALFGKGPSNSGAQQTSTLADIVKQEKPKHHKALFGKPVSSESEESGKMGLFGRQSESSRQAEAVQGSQPREFKFQPTEGASVKEEIHNVKSEPVTHSGLFGKPGGKPATKGLFGKPPPKEESDLDSEESPGRGFRPRLPRVGEEQAARSSRTLFGKPVTQSTRQSRGSDEGLKGRRLSVSRQISDDLSGKVAIVCRNVPSKFNNHTFLRNHFSRYGKVTKVFPNQAKMQATIHFETHEQAADAKRRGRLLARGCPPLTIFWSSYTTPLSPSPKGSSHDHGQKRETAAGSRETVPGPSRQYTWRRGDAVNEELDSMSGTHDLRYDRRKSPSPRPQEMGSRTPEKRVRSASPGPAAPSISIDTRSDKVQLSSFQGVVARTSTDRVHLLDLRDKYIRQNRKKNRTDMKRAFIGTCPDMCPEKERYDREDKRRLSYYEMVQGTENVPGRNPLVDHSRAVKEYLRSSPDQDEPLPHELRPLPVLQLTMTYLLCEIADQGQDGYWGDWFDYLWNRTRGIRKDITQQQLCDRQAAELIEKCARFHIFCSERLCEEDMHSFDAKINNENLTKCLQTLREFYHDLEKKQKVFCQNEAEFRAYTVLMNLNEGDILREVQQLRPDVRSTPEIKFALQVHAALNSNNYVRFFRLVKQSSFGCACIMHRYFTQVRNRALTSMMRSYGMGTKPAQIPLSELVRLLGFENEKEAADFSEHYGFIVEDDSVILDKNDYLEPETAWLPRRSIHLIESKRMVSVGEMINGEKLPMWNIPEPSSSFDEHGRFFSAVDLPGIDTTAQSMPHISTAEVSGQTEVRKEPIAKATRVEPPAAEQPAKPAFTNENVKDMAKLLFWEVIDEMCKNIGKEKMTEIQELLDIGAAEMENTVNSTVRDIALTVAQDVYDRAQAEHQRALQQEREERCDRVAATLTEELIEEILQEQGLSLATMEINELKAKLEAESKARVTVEINQEITLEVISKMVQECAAEVYETDVTQRLKQLQELEDIVKLSRTGKFLRRWKKEYKAVIKLKRAMMAFPSSASMESAPDLLDHLILDKQTRLTVDTPVQVEERRKKIDTQISMQYLYHRLLSERAWQPLDLSKLVGPKLQEKLRTTHKGSKERKHLYWKLVMYLPEVDPNDNKSPSQESRATAQLCDWLKAKMSRGKKPPPEKILKTEVLSLYKTVVTAQTTPRPSVNLGICVRSISGLPSEDELLLLDEERCMLGTDALIFVLPANPNMDDPYSDYWYSNVQRLQELLEVKPSNQEFPLVIIVAASASQDVSYNSLSERLNLDLFIEQGFICDVKIVVVEFDENTAQGINVVDPKVSEKLCESIQWLADLCNLPPDLTVSYLKDCIEGFLMEEYYTPVLQNLRKRKMLGHIHQGPDVLLELYNSVIQHLCDTLTSESLLTVSWPVPEFTRNDELSTPPSHWNTEDQFDYLKQLIQSLELPRFVSFLYEPKGWEQVKEKVSNYVTSVVDKEYGPASITLVSRLKKLLHQVEVDFEETCYLQEGLDNCEPTYDSIPWTELLSICINYRLATLDIMDPNVNTMAGSDTELKVAYFKSELDNFDPPHAWRHIESDQSILDTSSLNKVIHTAAEKVREKLTHSIVTSQSSVPVVDRENQPPEADREPQISSTVPSALIKSFQEERRRSDHFQKYLENALKSNQEFALFKEQPSELNLKETEWKLASPKMFGDTFGTPGLERKDFPLTHSDLDVSLGTRLFGNRTIHFNDESCFGNGDQLTSERSATLKRKSLGHIPQNTKRLSLGVPSQEDYLETSKNETFEAVTKESDVDITTLPSRARRQRLSDVYGDDKVMFAVYEPTVAEDIDLFKNEIKANRRESDIFEKKLLAALKSDPFSQESF